MALHGSIDTLTHRRIVGWACDTDTPLTRQPLMVCIGSRVLVRCTADLLREDIPQVGFGDGRHGFAASLPVKLLSQRQGYLISVRREGDGLHLPGSPYVLKAALRIVR